MFEKNVKFLCDVIGDENYAENVFKRITEMYAVGVNNVSFTYFLIINLFSYQIFDLKKIIKWFVAQKIHIKYYIFIVVSFIQIHI